MRPFVAMFLCHVLIGVEDVFLALFCETNGLTLVDDDLFQCHSHSKQMKMKIRKKYTQK